MFVPLSLHYIRGPSIHHRRLHKKEWSTHLVLSRHMFVHEYTYIRNTQNNLTTSLCRDIHCNDCDCCDCCHHLAHTGGRLSYVLSNEEEPVGSGDESSHGTSSEVGCDITPTNWRFLSSPTKRTVAGVLVIVPITVTSFVGVRFFRIVARLERTILSFFVHCEIGIIVPYQHTKCLTLHTRLVWAVIAFGGG
jgi:hypothetical protein